MGSIQDTVAVQTPGSLFALMFTGHPLITGGVTSDIVTLYGGVVVKQLTFAVSVTVTVPVPEAPQFTKTVLDVDEPLIVPPVTTQANVFPVLGVEYITPFSNGHTLMFPDIEGDGSGVNVRVAPLEVTGDAPQVAGDHTPVYITVLPDTRSSKSQC